MPILIVTCYSLYVSPVQTIDNDVDLLDRSFGFTTSVEAAQRAIHVAVTEATCNLPNGIGIVKVTHNITVLNYNEHKCNLSAPTSHLE